MADDLGYEVIGANGCTSYKTPVLDAIASQGLRFTNCFSNPICTPSRVKLMTGMSNVRNYVRFGLLPETEITFGNLLKKAGYKTCIAGKWQLGKAKGLPQKFGFDEACLWQQFRPRTRQGGFDTRFTNPRLEINNEEKNFDNGEFGPDIVNNFVLNFIEENKAEPFFVYYPMILTHCPFIPTPGHPDYDSKSLGSPTYKGNAKYYGAMDNYCDKLVGKVKKKLEDLGLAENTLFIFTGDNGTDVPVVSMLNGKKVAGGKDTMTDNGTRVPLIISWPAVIKEARVSNELVDFSDFLPTFCELAGVELPTDRAYDGVSLIPSLKGESTREKPYVYIWYAGKVISRTEKFMYRKQKGKVDFFEFSGAYEPSEQK
ncbi:MAG: sulfatase-like hydrolase/transferase, partial [Lentisphaeraceae bacterium]|nr:sulfatase-like hydrolase/transferase [Lentisphaeraceae bacterium]